MEIPPADPRRVAARALGRTPQEHVALEHELARRRAERAYERPIPQRTPRGIERRRQRQPRTHVHRHGGVGPSRVAEPEPQVQDDPGVLFRRYFDPSPERNAEAAAYEAAYEAAERDPELVATRAAIRSQPGLSDLCKTILLLTTQIPPGRWTTYCALRDHIRDTDHCPYPVLSVGTYLNQNPLGRAVPTHRVVGQFGRFGRPFQWGVHCDDPEETADLLAAEGVGFKIDGNPKGSAFREFVGCP
ncbi:hypothetical protein F4779DRAFT_156944 [Xylariaceae sp. FL0662B]|nr:hypothetical protein F4779DRAFT_156944 [Xylariaceae sp. FL0662B]